MIIPDAHEVLPRLWIGPQGSCDAAPESVFRICVLEEPHSARCQHMRILGENGKAQISSLDLVANMIDVRFGDGWNLLVHCGAGVERSPLAVAYWMTRRFGYSFDEAYAWLKQHRPQVEDRRVWLEA